MLFQKALPFLILRSVQAVLLVITVSLIGSGSGIGGPLLTCGLQIIPQNGDIGNWGTYKILFPVYGGRIGGQYFAWVMAFLFFLASIGVAVLTLPMLQLEHQFPQLGMIVFVYTIAGGGMMILIAALEGWYASWPFEPPVKPGSCDLTVAGWAAAVVFCIAIAVIYFVDAFLTYRKRHEFPLMPTAPPPPPMQVQPVVAVAPPVIVESPPPPPPGVDVQAQPVQVNVQVQPVQPVQANLQVQPPQANVQAQPVGANVEVKPAEAKQFTPWTPDAKK